MITTRFEPERHLYVMKLTGDITAAEVVAGYDAAFADSTFKSDMHAVWDLTGLSLVSVPVSEVRKVPPGLRDYARRRGP